VLASSSLLLAMDYQQRVKQNSVPIAVIHNYVPIGNLVSSLVFHCTSSTNRLYRFI